MFCYHFVITKLKWPEGKHVEESYIYVYIYIGAFQAALAVKNPPANAGDIRYSGSISGLGRFPG